MLLSFRLFILKMTTNPFANVTLKKVQTKEPTQKEPLVQLCENEDQYRQLMLETYLGRRND